MNGATKRCLGLLVIAVVVAVFALDTGAYCVPQREERTVWWTYYECCGYIGSNGGWVDGYKRYYQRQYRDRLPDCSWTSWTYFGDMWTTCHWGSCQVQASLAPPTGLESFPWLDEPAAMSVDCRLG